MRNLIALCSNKERSSIAYEDTLFRLRKYYMEGNENEQAHLLSLTKNCKQLQEDMTYVCPSAD